MRYHEFAPDSALAPWVKCFWLMENLPGAGDGPMDAVVPDGCPEIIVHYGDRFVEEVGGRRRGQPGAIVAGQLPRPLLLRPTGRIGMVAARFRPDGVFALFGLPMHELVDRRVPLDAIRGDAPALQGRIAEASSDRERVAHLAAFLKRQLARRHRVDLDPLIQHNVQAIIASGGSISLDELAVRAGVTARQLERRFQVCVGVSPKFLCRIIRFRRVFDRLRDQTPWPMIALRCGFFDQSHLIRDFKQFAGQSPTAFLASQSWFARCFTQCETARC